MTYPFLLRRATPADRNAVTAIVEAFDPHDWVRDEFDTMLTVKPPAGLFVAEQAGQVFACHSVEFPGPGDAYLSAMRLHPSYQGKGLGTLLCRAQVEQVRAAGGENIFLLSKVTNTPAHQTVAKNGFENRGEWVVYDGLNPVALPDPKKARPGRPQDLVKVLRFRHEQETGTLGSVIASSYSAWVVKTLRDSDWNPERMAVVEGGKTLEGLMLYNIHDGRLLIRRLEGTPAAAADLLAYAARESARHECKAWSIGLPKSAEPLLAPLNLDPEAAFYPYVFCLCSGKIPE
ncbi:MAG TPA: GNAT family N-acetyltransferase [Symbiobacteriaceae bacterium]|jgi:GNAT superfamily N-acetyltransferase